MAHTEPTMTPAQIASLIDGALRHPHPVSFLDAVVMTSRAISRPVGGTTAAWIECLLAEDEAEVLMGLRAAWRRGQGA